jgi:hypothetical protein
MIPRQAPNFTELFESVLRCRAVYIPDVASRKAQFAVLGCTVLAAFESDRNQAVLHRDSRGRLTYTIAGTRFSEGSLPERFGDLLADWKCDPYFIGSDRAVAELPFKYSEELYVWLFNTMSDLGLVGPTGSFDEPVRIEGHSKGGWQATYATEYLDASNIAHITAWESPHQGNDAYWASVVQRGLIGKITQVYHGQDPWALWDWESDILNKGPAPVLWVAPHGNYQGHPPGWIWAMQSDLPIAKFTNLYELPNASDHGPDSLVDIVGKLATGPANLMAASADQRKEAA